MRRRADKDSPAWILRFDTVESDRGRGRAPGRGRRGTLRERVSFTRCASLDGRDEPGRALPKHLRRALDAGCPNVQEVCRIGLRNSLS